ncbi:MAG: MarR family transcriptional regulator [Dehalococcoidales bacterium]|jgi:DNA-binding MarR family transcriptional regulator|nr:MarR family transcriptional regulator [Dehalococcoidales bacterium]
MDKSELISKILELQKLISIKLRDETPDPWLALNLTIAQLKSLLFIYSRGTTNFKMLAKALHVTPPRVTGIIDRLAEQGLVKRAENPENRRMQFLSLTEKGINLLTELKTQNTTRLLEVMNKLSMDELTALATGLAAIARVMDSNKENQPDEYNRGKRIIQKIR